MGNPAGGTIFGADRLRDLYPGGAPPAPIQPTPISGSTQPGYTDSNGLISSIVNGSNVPGSSSGAPNTGVMVGPNGPINKGLPMERGGGLLPKGTAPPTGVMIGAPLGKREEGIPTRGGDTGSSLIREPQLPKFQSPGLNQPVGPISELVGKPEGVVPPFGGAPAPKMMSETEWRDQFRQEAAKRAKSPGGGIVSDVVAAPPAPITPTTQPGYKPSETLEQRRARIQKNRRAKGEIQ